MAENPYDSRFADYLVCAAAYAREYPRQRKGQAYFNVLRDLYPLTAQSIVGTACDPFHRDEVLDDFLTVVEEKLRED